MFRNIYGKLLSLMLLLSVTVAVVLVTPVASYGAEGIIAPFNICDLGDDEDQ